MTTLDITAISKLKHAELWKAAKNSRRCAEGVHDMTELIDEVWLKQCGWVPIGNTWYPPESSHPQKYTMPILFWVRVDGTIRLGGGNEWKSGNDARRSQLRLLCAALGMSLTETQMDNDPPRYSDCISCGDPIEENNGDPLDVQDAMRVRCRLCAMDSLGIKVPNFGAFQQHDTGGGRRVIRETKTH